LIRILLTITLIFPVLAEAAQCQGRDGNWYPYSHPICSGGSQSVPSTDSNNRPNGGFSSGATNPACQVSESKARADLAANLGSRYPNSYSTQKMLLDSGMEKFRALCAIPINPISDGILKRLTDTYYPNFGTIHMLYESNMKSYKELHQ
jgi:hypothetical protein